MGEENADETQTASSISWPPISTRSIRLQVHDAGSDGYEQDGSRWHDWDVYGIPGWQSDQEGVISVPSHYKTVPDTTNLKYPKPRIEPNQYKEPIGPKKQTTAEKINSVVSKVRGWAQNHPENRNRPEPRERREPKERKSPRRTTRVDRYVDGKLAETVYFDEKPEPRKKRQSAPRERKQGSPFGSLGAGMRVGDFLPSSGVTAQPRKAKKRKPLKELGWHDPSYIPENIRGFF